VANKRREPALSDLKDRRQGRAWMKMCSWGGWPEWWRTTPHEERHLAISWAMDGIRPWGEQGRFILCFEKNVRGIYFQVFFLIPLPSFL
jgi:hypothetical protein